MKLKLLAAFMLLSLPIVGCHSNAIKPTNKLTKQDSLALEMKSYYKRLDSAWSLFYTSRKYQQKIQSARDKYLNQGYLYLIDMNEKHLKGRDRILDSIPYWEKKRDSLRKLSDKISLN